MLNDSVQFDDHENHVCCMNPAGDTRHISCTSRVTAHFLLKFPNFHQQWEHGSSEQSLTDTIKLADPENPLLCASIWDVSLAQAKLQPILC